MSGWIGVDLDGTLAQYDGSIINIGPPTTNEFGPTMVERIKNWRKSGYDVRIFTARVGPGNGDDIVAEQTKLIEDWCEENIGEKLPITATKDFGMVELWDDRAIQVHNGHPETVYSLWRGGKISHVTHEPMGKLITVNDVTNLLNEIASLRHELQHAKRECVLLQGVIDSGNPNL